MKLHRLTSALLVAGLALAASASHAEGFKFLPGLNAGFKFEPTLAVSLGAMNAAGGNDDAMTVYGLDFNMNCGLIQTPDNRIRTHIQINHVDESGVKSTSFELSPRYTLPIGGGFSVGAGPALAMVKVDNGNTDKNLFGYGAVAGLNYRAGMLYAGADVRYLNTNERDNVQFENWAVLAKVGINF
ncbi:hypothetical protein [Dechloromonas sp. A34]|uniref:hypothetical protein n=1 Tax=Dechloromonas sp. A34 TaxID=447588 RepID=UPI00224907DE|nr:hypothetical protein [Dechloromonas sp. A34]